MNQTSAQKLSFHVKDLVSFYYQDLGNLAGGNLHLVLDDGNVDNDCIDICESACKEENDTIGIALCLLLRSLPVKSRQFVVA